MRIAVIGGGPGGLYFAALTKALHPEARDPCVRAQCARGHVRLRRRVQRRDPGRHRARRPGDPCPHDRAVRPLGRRRRALPRHGDHRRGAGVRRDEPQGPAADPAGALRRTGRPGRLPYGGAGRRCAGPRLRPGHRLRRGELRRPHQVRRRLRSHGRPAPEQVHVARHRSGVRGVQVLHLRDRRTASCRCTAIPTTPATARSSSRCTTTCGVAPASGPPSGAPFRPGSATRSRSPASASCWAASSRGTRSWPTTRSGRASRPSPTGPGGTATSSSWATPRTPRTSPSARARSWRWRTRWRWSPACTNNPMCPRR